MLSTRLARIPLDHLVAEMIAFPLASESAFSLGLCRLERSPRLPGLCGPTAELWRHAENAFTASMPSVSMEEIYAIRDQTWFRLIRPTGDGPLFLIDNLCLVANDFLRLEGEIARPFAECNQLTQGGSLASRPPDRTAFWWLSLALPEDLLLASLPSGVDPIRVHGAAATECDWTSPQVESMLRDKGIAETHLHLGAAFSFPLLWSEVMRGIGDRSGKPRERQEQFCGPGAAFREGRDFSDWLIRCAIARITMDLFLTSPSSGSFATARSSLARRLLGAFRRTSEEEEIRICLGDLHRGSISQSGTRATFSHLQSIYRTILERLSRRPRCDPLVILSGESRREGGDAEKAFLRRAIGFVTDPARNRADDGFERLFLQYCRVRNLFYRHVVQRPLTSGLQWFIRHFARLSPGKRNLSVARLVATGARTSGFGRGLKSFEFRMSPGSARKPSSNSELLLLVKQLFPVVNALRNASEEKDFEAGLVLHIAKDRGQAFGAGVPAPHGARSTSDPRTGRFGFRYEDFVHLAFQALVLK